MISDRMEPDNEGTSHRQDRVQGLHLKIGEPMISTLLNVWRTCRYTTTLDATGKLPDIIHRIFHVDVIATALADMRNSFMHCVSTRTI